MDWPTDREAEIRDATDEECAEHRHEDHPTNYKEAAKRVRREQKKKQKGRGVGQEFDVKDSFFD